MGIGLECRGARVASVVRIRDRGLASAPGTMEVERPCGAGIRGKYRWLLPERLRRRNLWRDHLDLDGARTIWADIGREPRSTPE